MGSCAAHPYIYRLTIDEEASEIEFASWRLEVNLRSTSGSIGASWAVKPISDDWTSDMSGSKNSRLATPVSWDLMRADVWHVCSYSERTIQYDCNSIYIKPSIGSWNRIDFRFGPLIPPAWSGAPPGRGIHWFGGVISCDPCDLRGTDFGIDDVDGCESREIPKEGRLMDIFLGVTALGKVVRRWWVLVILAVWARRLGVDLGLPSALNGTMSSMIESFNLSRVELNSFRANMIQC